MQRDDIILKQQAADSALATNAVLRNTYMLLAMTLMFSALTAGLAMAMNAAPINPFITIIGYFALLFVTTKLRNSGWGLVSVFALTGFMGYTLGPILNLYIHGFSNGSEIVLMSLGSTGVIFLALSAYAVISRKNFSFMGGFLSIGILVAFLASIGALLFKIPALMLAVSAAFVFLSSGLILFETSRIIHGGERNYIMATITLYISIYNLFLSLLNILSALNGRN